jgi:hypothetical protein
MSPKLTNVSTAIVTDKKWWLKHFVLHLYQFYFILRIHRNLECFSHARLPQPGFSNSQRLCTIFFKHSCCLCQIWMVKTFAILYCNCLVLFEKLLPTLATLGNATQIKSYLFVSHYQGGQSECRHHHWQVGVVKTFTVLCCDYPTSFHFSMILRTVS